ncbi:hypothetical protein ACVWY2_009042 [Bradyrhizobium sp. JR6.1]
MACRTGWVLRIVVVSLLVMLLPLMSAQAASMAFRINPPTISALTDARESLKPAEQAIVGTAVKKAIAGLHFYPGHSRLRSLTNRRRT